MMDVNSPYCGNHFVIYTLLIHHIIHLKHTLFFVNYITVKWGGKAPFYYFYGDYTMIMEQNAEAANRKHGRDKS